MSAAPRPLRNLVVKNGYGQLGNRLYRLGNLIAFAIEHGLDVYDFAFKDHDCATYFQNTRDTEYLYFSGAEPNNARVTGAADMLRILDEDSGLLFNDEDALDLDLVELRAMERETIFIEGFHFQADTLTPKHHDSIGAFLRPADEAKARVDFAFGQMRAQLDCIVGVHMRQGDFRAWGDGAYFYAAEEFADRCREMSALLAGKRIAFLVFSDESVKREAFDGLPAFFSGGSVIEDMYSLSRCDYILAPPHSTFSGWSSYFGRVPMIRMSRDGKSLALEDFKPNRILNNL